ncbi:homeobox-like domain superfamily [Holotrichia oblita]|uniref:Homeobox-like domain superfamily n=1 Tax=Holotrichia oblita TaxID=644536 RepID=A0ACB9T6T5_HOLOL|nr:homeobox-like domain superfamily [Holotrichia oblita]
MLKRGKAAGHDSITAEMIKNMGRYGMEIMVSKYKRTTNLQEWFSENMKRALEAIKNKEMGWLKACKTFGVPAATLRRRAKNDTECKKTLVTFPEELEEALCRRVLELESRLFGNTAKELCIMAHWIPKAKSAVIISKTGAYFCGSSDSLQSASGQKIL